MSSNRSSPAVGSSDHADTMTAVQAIVGGSEWCVSFNAQPDDYRRGIRFYRERSSLKADYVRVVPAYDADSGAFVEYVIKAAEGCETDSEIIGSADTKLEALEIAQEEIEGFQAGDA